MKNNEMKMFYFYGSILFSSKINLISIEQLRHSHLNFMLREIAPLYSRT
jgi:hypothetical protein